MGDFRTEHVAAILVIALILVVAVIVFAGTSSSDHRIICHAWKVRADGAFEAETSSGTILFRRKDIELIEAHQGNDTYVWVCIGNLQRMVWIAFPANKEARQFAAQMEEFLRHKNL